MMRKIFTQTYVLLRQELTILLRNPFWIFFGLFQPTIYLLLFAPLLNAVAAHSGLPAGQSAIQFFVPGLLVMNAMINAGYAGFSLIERLESGFLERLRVLPISRLSIVLGFVLDNAVQIIFQSIILVAVSMAMGFCVPFVGLLASLALLLLVGTAMGSVSYSVALIVRDGGALAGTCGFITMPLMLLAGILLPVDFAPPFIKFLASCNPFYYAVLALRQLFGGNATAGCVATAFLFFTILCLITLSWFIRLTREAVA